MLNRIEIRHFAIIQSLDLDWSQGMTVITGETGAGKSIVIDALGLALGERAEVSCIYPGAEQAEVSGLFEVSTDSQAGIWLTENALCENADSAFTECLLRRIVSREGRSKCFINGRAVTLSQLKSLGSLLVDIHGQHDHQSLLKTKEQLNLLDRYADHADLVMAVNNAANQIKNLQVRKNLLEQEAQARQAKRELLSYQVEELELANPEPHLLDNLEQEFQIAATSQERTELCEQALTLLDGDDSGACLPGLSRIIERVGELAALDSKLNDLSDTLIQADSLLQDAKRELRHYHQHLDCDPEKLDSLNQQLALYHDLARKHRVNIKQLPELFSRLKTEFEQLQADDVALGGIQAEYEQALSHYQHCAKLLSNSRQKVALELENQVTDSIQLLAMQGGKFKIEFTPKESGFSASGIDNLEFMVAANPGQPPQAITKVASGGELSRISLAISVITAKQQLVPCLIFDEVDVGIGGGTAEIVGQLLRKLAANRQVICVTHQPQVASCGHQHLLASKTKTDSATSTQLVALNDEQRVNEIARMLGGLVISEKTLLHAQEMLGV